MKPPYRLGSDDIDKNKYLFSILYGKLPIYATRKRFLIWLFSRNLFFSKVAWPGHRGALAAKGASRLGKELVSDKTKFSKANL